MDIRTILRLADAYQAHTGLSRSTISTYAVNDGKRLASFETGSTCTLRIADRFVNWFSTNWPDDLEWPRSIPRPPRNKKEAA